MNEGEYIFDSLVLPFERVCGFHICFHRYTGKIAELSSRGRTKHYNPYCECVKTKFGQEVCMGFDMGQVQSFLSSQPDGFFKECHGGLVECVIPVRDGTTLVGIIFIGLFRRGDFFGDNDSVLRTKKILKMSKDFKQECQKLPVLTKELASDVFGIGQTIRSRMEQEIRQVLQNDSGENRLKNSINEFLQLNFTNDIKLEDLAKHIGLSVSRTSHILKELFRKNYPEILCNHRIEHSKYLLSHSRLAICKIAEKVGFSEAAYFHRLFKNSTGLTPGQYRKRNAQRTQV